MEIDELKNAWKSLPTSYKNQNQIDMMTKINSHPTLKRVRTKLLIEILWLLAFLLLYWDGFDGADKPLYANIVLVVSLMLFLVHDIRMYLTLQNPIRAQNIRLSLEKFAAQFKRLALDYIALSVLFGIAFLLFFLTSVSFTTEKYLLTGGIVLTSGGFFYWSYKSWMKRVRHVQSTLEELLSDISPT